jgi:hypothetical protein
MHVPPRPWGSCVFSNFVRILKVTDKWPLHECLSRGVPSILCLPHLFYVCGAYDDWAFYCYLHRALLVCLPHGVQIRILGLEYKNCFDAVNIICTLGWICT